MIGLRLTGSAWLSLQMRNLLAKEGETWKRTMSPTPSQARYTSRTPRLTGEGMKWRTSSHERFVEGRSVSDCVNVKLLAWSFLARNLFPLGAGKDRA